MLSIVQVTFANSKQFSSQASKIQNYTNPAGSKKIKY